MATFLGWLPTSCSGNPPLRAAPADDEASAVGRRHPADACDLRRVKGEDLIGRFRWLRPIVGGSILLGAVRPLDNEMPLRVYQDERILVGGRDLRAVDFEGSEIWRSDGGTGRDLLVQALDHQDERVAFAGIVQRGIKRSAVVGVGSALTGEMRWQHELTSDVENVAARGVTILPGGDVIVLGTFAGEIRLPGKMLVSHGSIDGFAIRLRAEDGEPVWASRFGGPGQDSIGVSAMNVDGTTWFVGSFSGSAEIGGTTIHSAMRSRDAYVAQVSADGEIRVVVRLSGPRHTEGISSVFHTAVGTYLVGYFSLEMWIGDIKLKAAPPLGANGFVAFADRAGTVVWAKMIPWIRSAGAAAAAASEGGLWILSNGDSMDIDKSMTMQLSHFSPTGERSFSADVGTGSPRAVAQVGSRIVFGSVIYLEGRRTFHLTFATLE